MKRLPFIPLFLILLVGTLVGGTLVWQHAALFVPMRWPWMPGGAGRDYLYYALKQNDGFVLARAPKGADGQPLAQPQTLLHFGGGFGLFPSDAISSIQLSPDGKYLAVDGMHGDGEQVWMYDIQNMSLSLLPASVSGNFLHWVPGGDSHTFLYRPMFPLLLRYPMTDRRNEEHLTSLPKPPNMDHSSGTMPNMSSSHRAGLDGFALGPNALMSNGSWNPGLWVVDAATGSHQNIDIGEASANLIDAAPSPDGTHIVYSTTNGLGTGSTTFVMSRDGSNRAQLFTIKNTQQSIAGLFTWSPDGSRIAYERLADSATPFLAAGLWVMDTRGGLQRYVTNADGGHGFMPVWSPDGQKLAFVARTNGADLHADNDEQALQSAVDVVDLATLQVQQVGAEEQTHLPINSNPVWVAHGTQITFTALNPINRDLGGTQRYWMATIPSVTNPGSQNQARVIPLSPEISHVIA